VIHPYQWWCELTSKISRQYIQLAIIPTVFTLVGFFGMYWFYSHYWTNWLIIGLGIAVTAAGEKIYGEVLWNPAYLIDRWDNRAAAFFGALSFVVSVIGTNISANSISAANDLMVIFPKYVNIRRGQIISAVIGGWVLCPWEILSSAPGFLAFMNGYTVFLGPFAAMWVDSTLLTTWYTFYLYLAP
jgi:nucleobase:cation symporter-1, NCS1 family